MSRVASYDLYIDEDREDEFRELVQERFGTAIELNWRDTEDI